MDKWEYLTKFIEANLKNNEEARLYAEQSGEVKPVYTPEAMIPELNRLGAKGWELVHMQPVYIGNNYDVLVHEGGGMKRWAYHYFCVFKRRG